MVAGCFNIKQLQTIRKMSQIIKDLILLYFLYVCVFFMYMRLDLFIYFS